MKALTTFGHPLYWRDIRTLPGLVKIGGKLKEFLDNETRCFSYLLDMAVTVKVARTWTEQL